MALSLALQMVTSLQSLLLLFIAVSQFSACHNGLDLLAKTPKKHQHSLQLVLAS